MYGDARHLLATGTRMHTVKEPLG
ncbi:hypothetical protein JL09_g6346 [Pichia kudriavzevii]|uniref:Uncharacterized protein n=1 Tax=Pichia kudriavzevii TaxID=4909 RepID=A0A099NRE2_PICKU|nr:hypothetical protein JL09_g6346 [Pichia kudriavzevii]